MSFNEYHWNIYLKNNEKIAIILGQKVSYVLKFSNNILDQNSTAGSNEG